MSCLSMRTTLEPFAAAQVARRSGTKPAGTNDDSIHLAARDAACSGIDTSDRSVSRGWSSRQRCRNGLRNFAIVGVDGLISDLCAPPLRR
jgi:hypothetical protein